MDFQTKPEICEYMVGLLHDTDLCVLEPTPGEGNLVKALKAAGHHVTAPKYFYDLPQSYYHAVVMNPPFTPMKEGYRILQACLALAPIVIALMPWLTVINSERRSQMLYHYGIRSITHLPRSAFPGTRVQTCILHLHKDWCNPIMFHFYGQEKWVHATEDSDGQF